LNRSFDACKARIYEKTGKVGAWRSTLTPRASGRRIVQVKLGSAGQLYDPNGNHQSVSAATQSRDCLRYDSAGRIQRFAGIRLHLRRWTLRALLQCHSLRRSRAFGHEVGGCKRLL
jgi:hypothetical protein